MQFTVVPNVIKLIYTSKKKDDFSRIPDELLQSFGEPQFSMLLNLADRQRLAHADIEKVKKALVEQGFYLQVPPPVESMLNAYLDELKKSEKTE
ncbi:YcgL domain protein [Proteus penneri ATCC 35198]|nr:YcgL domain protein [Proteus penneri ATCC 35198]